MTVSSTLNKVIYPGSSAQTTFSFSFAFPGGTATQEAANIQVFYTDTLGNITLLTAGPGATNYQITFNPPSGTNPTPTGGVVTYNPNSVPIALGTFLTIFRSLPLTQSTSLQNQGTLYQPVTEAALDYEMMVSQQVLEVQSRALVVSVSDPAPSTLPAVAARKNLFLAFDSSGNPIAALPGGASTPVSSAMAPVVSAASLAAGRTAFGLGTMATEGIGFGLQPDGAGNVDINFSGVVDSTPQLVTSSFLVTRRYLSANVTYTLPQISTLFAGFGFWINTQAFSATLAINAGDSFNGMSTGTSLVIGPGQTVYISTNGGTTWFVDFGNQSGFNAAQNLQLNASVAASALTISLKDRNGNDPSATSPIIVEFSLFGNNVSRAVSTPLSVTVPNGASLGTGNGLTNRIWIGLFDNAGTPVLGVYNSLSFPSPGNVSILPWDETAAQTTTAISAGSTSPQVWYTQGGALSAKAVRILGFIESTQPTAGAWTVTPSKIQLFGPGIKKPGDTIQEASVVTTTAGTTAAVTFTPLGSGQSITIIPVSAADVIRVDCSGTVSNGAAPALQMSRGNVAATNLIGNVSATPSGSAPGGSLTMWAYDLPNTSGSQLYVVQGKVTSGTLSFGGANLQTVMSAKEIFI
jgi:hypothetical protein